MTMRRTQTHTHSTAVRCSCTRMPTASSPIHWLGRMPNYQGDTTTSARIVYGDNTPDVSEAPAP
ncbi:hypothetical protein DAI22_06g166600 [Oryza sativa Japonica Group]|nr:hypothetical protein DAI22_06g166600 [Oryza sativa Japonica Group]